jgi:hypothetical protein
VNGTRTSIQNGSIATGSLSAQLSKSAQCDECQNIGSWVAINITHSSARYSDTSHGVSELMNCSGSCHIDTDSSLTTIKDHRNGEHQTMEGGF